jgi:hypothetical protein
MTEPITYGDYVVIALADTENKAAINSDFFLFQYMGF